MRFSSASALAALLIGAALGIDSISVDAERAVRAIGAVVCAAPADQASRHTAIGSA